MERSFRKALAASSAASLTSNVHRPSVNERTMKIQKAAHLLTVLAPTRAITSMSTTVRAAAPHGRFVEPLLDPLQNHPPPPPPTPLQCSNVDADVVTRFGRRNPFVHQVSCMDRRVCTQKKNGGATSRAQRESRAQTKSWSQRRLSF